MKLAYDLSPWLRHAAWIGAIACNVGCTSIPVCNAEKCIAECECGIQGHEGCCTWDPLYHQTAWSPLAAELHGCNHNYTGYGTTPVGQVQPAAETPATVESTAPADVTLPMPPSGEAPAELDPPPRLKSSGFTR